MDLTFPQPSPFSQEPGGLLAPAALEGLEGLGDGDGQCMGCIALVLPPTTTWDPTLLSDGSEAISDTADLVAQPPDPDPLEALLITDPCGLPPAAFCWLLPPPAESVEASVTEDALTGQAIPLESLNSTGPEEPIDPIACLPPEDPWTAVDPVPVIEGWLDDDSTIEIEDPSDAGFDAQGELIALWSETASAEAWLTIGYALGLVTPDPEGWGEPTPWDEAPGDSPGKETSFHPWVIYCLFNEFLSLWPTPSLEGDDTIGDPEIWWPETTGAESGGDPESEPWFFAFDHNNPLPYWRTATTLIADAPTGFGAAGNALELDPLGTAASGRPHWTGLAAGTSNLPEVPLHGAALPATPSSPVRASESFTVSTLAGDIKRTNRFDDVLSTLLRDTTRTAGDSGNAGSLEIGDPPRTISDLLDHLLFIRPSSRRNA